MTAPTPECTCPLYGGLHAWDCPPEARAARAAATPPPEPPRLRDVARQRGIQTEGADEVDVLTGRRFGPEDSETEPPRWATTDCAGHDFEAWGNARRIHMTHCYCAHPGGARP